MSDHYETQIGDLKDELLLVEEQLVKAEDVIRFYAQDEMFRQVYIKHPNFGNDARNYFKEKGES